MRESGNSSFAVARARLKAPLELTRLARKDAVAFPVVNFVFVIGVQNQDPFANPDCPKLGWVSAKVALSLQLIVGPDTK